MSEAGDPGEDLGTVLSLVRIMAAHATPTLRRDLLGIGSRVEAAIAAGRQEDVFLATMDGPSGRFVRRLLRAVRAYRIGRSSLPSIEAPFGAEKEKWGEAKKEVDGVNPSVVSCTRSVETRPGEAGDNARSTS